MAPRVLGVEEGLTRKRPGKNFIRGSRKTTPDANTVYERLFVASVGDYAIPTGHCSAGKDLYNPTCDIYYFEKQCVRYTRVYA